MTRCCSQWRQIPLYNFKQLTLPNKENYYISCQQCQGERQQASIIYSVAVDKLKQQWQQMIKRQPRTVLLKHQAEQYQYVQRSLLFRFPDIVDVQFVALAEKQSTLNIFSRSVYGYSDLGVNAKRVKQWLVNLQQELLTSLH